MASREPESSQFLGVGPGGQRGMFLQLRVAQDEAAELRDLMKREGVYSGDVIMESAEVPELAMLVGSFAAGLSGLAAVLRAFFHRHQHRSLTFVQGETTVEVKGMSDADMEALIERALGAAAQIQLERQRLYEGLPGPEGDTD